MGNALAIEVGQAYLAGEEGNKGIVVKYFGKKNPSVLHTSRKLATVWKCQSLYWVFDILHLLQGLLKLQKIHTSDQIIV